MDDNNSQGPVTGPDELKKLEEELKGLENPTQEGETAPAISQVPQPTIATQTEQPKQPKDSKTMMMAVGLLLLSLVGVGAYLLGTNRGTVQPAPTSYTSPTPTPEPTVNWKTYKNTELGVEFKYPDTWFTSMSKDGAILLDNEAVDGGNVVESEQVAVTLDVITNQALINSYSQNTSNISKQTNISGVVFDMVDLTEAAPTGQPPKQVLSAITVQEGKMYRFGLSDSAFQEIFDQILYTFKFLEPAPSIVPSLSPSGSPAATPGY